jgi:uncharacterized protein with PIN domain
MVLDTSAIVAILLDEPERPAFDSLIEDDPQRRARARTVGTLLMNFNVSVPKNGIRRVVLNYGDISIASAPLR